MKKILYIGYPAEHPERNQYVRLFSKDAELHLFAKNPGKDTASRHHHLDGISWLPRGIQVLIHLLRFKRKGEMDAFFSSHREWYLGVLNVLFAKRAKVTSIVRCAGDIVDSHKFKKNPLMKAITFLVNRNALRILKKADIIITMSQDVKEKLAAHSIPKERIRIVMQHMKLPKLGKKASKKGLRLEPKRKNVLFAGTLTKRKGLELFLELLNDPEIREQFHFIFAGKDVDGYARRLGRYENVTLLGKIAKEELQRYYATADLFVMPTYSEGFPKVVTEAYGAGCPIIARQVYGMERLADATFTKDKELKGLLKKTYRRKRKIVWPKEFKPETVEREFAKLIKDI